MNKLAVCFILIATPALAVRALMLGADNAAMAVIWIIGLALCLFLEPMIPADKDGTPRALSRWDRNDPY